MEEGNVITTNHWYIIINAVSTVNDWVTFKGHSSGISRNATTILSICHSRLLKHLNVSGFFSQLRLLTAYSVIVTLWTLLLFYFFVPPQISSIECSCRIYNITLLTVVTLGGAYDWVFTRSTETRDLLQWVVGLQQHRRCRLLVLKAGIAVS